MKNAPWEVTPRGRSLADERPPDPDDLASLAAVGEAD